MPPDLLQQIGLLLGYILVGVVLLLLSRSGDIEEAVGALVTRKMKRITDKATEAVKPVVVPSPTLDMISDTNLRVVNTGMDAVLLSVKQIQTTLDRNYEDQKLRDDDWKQWRQDVDRRLNRLENRQP